VAADGEVLMLDTPLHYRLRPRALRVLVPAPGRSPPSTSTASTAACRACWNGWRKRSPTSPACRRSRPATDASRPSRSKPPATARSGTASPVAPRRRDPGARRTPQWKSGAACPATTRRQARYLEADVAGLRIASVYLPNGNPVPSPNFDYKLAWFERFIRMRGT
jgi:hypothetical protein